MATAPVATGARCLDKDQLGGLRWHPAAEVVEVTLARANGPKTGDLSAMIWGHTGHRNGVVMDIEADVKRARRGQG